jgi:hypothetical protein
MVARNLYKAQSAFGSWCSGERWTGGGEGSELYWSRLGVTDALIEKVFPLVLRLEDLVLTNVTVFSFTGAMIVLDFYCAVQHVEKVVWPLFEAACKDAGYWLSCKRGTADLVNYAPVATRGTGYTFVIHFTKQEEIPA